MGHVSVTISYSFHCLTTETVKYINENCFIENLTASKLGMGIVKVLTVLLLLSIRYFNGILIGTFCYSFIHTYTYV